MKGLSLWQPSAGSLGEARAYVAGVLHGDGWCTRWALGLRVADREFAEAFAAAVNHVAGTSLVARLDERAYWLVRSGNKSGRHDGLKGYRPRGRAQVAAWLRGMFDSEGNACCSPSNMSECSYNRRVAFYSTDPATLAVTSSRLALLGVAARARAMRSSATHKGKRTVYELKLVNNKENFARFASVVGSTIRRKAETLARVHGTYVDPFIYRSKGGRRGCAARWGNPHEGA